MRGEAPAWGSAAGWGVVRPRPSGRVAGVSMAGFLSGDAGPVDVPVVPHPTITLVLEFGSGPHVVDVATGRRRRGNLVAGYLHGALRVRGEHVECVQVRLSPLVARAVLGVSPAALDGRVIALDDLWGREAARLRQRLGEATTWPARFALAEELVRHRAAAGPSVDPEVAWAWRRITGSGGLARVEDLAAEVGWSRKRLWSRFRTQVGLPPKRAARLVRFDRAAHQLAAGDAAAQVAVDSGYADQSHLPPGRGGVHHTHPGRPGRPALAGGGRHRVGAVRRRGASSGRPPAVRARRGPGGTRVLTALGGRRRVPSGAVRSGRRGTGRVRVARGRVTGIGRALCEHTCM